MKNLKSIVLTVVICIEFTNLSLAQIITDTTKKNNTDTILSKIPVDEFKEDLTAGFTAFDTTRSMNEMVAASNHLGLIAKKWTDQWSANYYAGYSLIILSYVEKDEKKRDAYLDDADILVNKAKEEYKSDYDEMYVLDAMLANARLAVKPMGRFKKYGDLFNSGIEKAKSMQPNNPRIYFLQGNSIYYTPKMFGGGSKNAFQYFEKAAELYQNEKEDDINKPYWGKRKNAEMLNKCREPLK